jgi:hypothetical protein
MSEEGFPPQTPHSDHVAHTAPAESHLLKKNLWQRWMAWSGSFLVLSILAHVILLGGATVLVVQVVQSRKEKMKFTAPPPSSAGAAEHKVKPSKKTAAAAPAISKRIASTAANASIALPAMDMNASTGPDVMASVMSGLGSAGLGGGTGGAGAGGMASMPLAGLTAFGFKGTAMSGGLVGNLYDLKQTPDHQPTDIKDDGTYKDEKAIRALPLREERKFFGDHFFEAYKHPEKAAVFSDGIRAEGSFLSEFLAGDWDESKLKKFYKAKDPMVTYQFSIPRTSAKEAVKAFGVENEVKPTHLLIVYRGKVRAPRDGTFRFVTMSRGGLVCVRFDGQRVLGAAYYGSHFMVNMESFKFPPDHYKKPIPYCTYSAGPWFSVQAGKTYPIEIVLGLGQEAFGTNLMIEELNPPAPYEKSKWQWQTDQGSQFQTAESLKNPFIFYRIPLFSLRKGMPIPPFKCPTGPFTLDPTANPEETKSFIREGPHLGDADPGEPTIFSGTK